jgi:hypothetical protein
MKFMNNIGTLAFVMTGYFPELFAHYFAFCRQAEWHSTGSEVRLLGSEAWP